MYKNMSGTQDDEADDRILLKWLEMNRSVYRVLFRRIKLKDQYISKCNK